MKPEQALEHRQRVAELLVSRPHDGRKVTLRENRGGWRYEGLSGICECLSEDGSHMVLKVEHDPESYWPLGSTLLVVLDHETYPMYEDDPPVVVILSPEVRALLEGN